MREEQVLGIATIATLLIGGCEPSAELPKYGDRAALMVYAPDPPNYCKKDDGSTDSEQQPRRRELSYHTDCSRLCAGVANAGEIVVGCYDARATKAYHGNLSSTRDLRENEEQQIYCRGTRKEEAMREPLVYGESETLIACQMKRGSSK
jgi:hypothetical protein